MKETVISLTSIETIYLVGSFSLLVIAAYYIGRWERRRK